jgi:hypothetical protein
MYSTVAETRSGSGRDTSRIRKMIPSRVLSLSAAAEDQSGPWDWMITHPSSATCRRQAARNAARTGMSAALIKCDASSTASNRRPSERSSIRAHTVCAPRTCASISEDSSTATTW